MNQSSDPNAAVAASLAPASRLRRVLQKVWWLHSLFALSFGVVVMFFARKGLAHADKVLMALGASWILVFVAFRFIVGPANRKPDERLVKKGVRLVTNYVIKQMYQQMFFFLVPLYAASATWSLSSPNWWIVPFLLVCAVLSTLDLVFDNFIMEHKKIAAAMYGLCMFSVLNVLLPLTFHVPHFDALMTAAAITPMAVALLSYPVATVLLGRGLLLVVACTGLLATACYLGRVFVPPAPLGMTAGGIGHGTPGSYECVPGPIRTMRHDQVNGLRCVTEISEPGGINDALVHRWILDGSEIARKTPSQMADCPGMMLRSELDESELPGDVRGKWSCRLETGDGQLVGLMKFVVKTPTSSTQSPAPSEPLADRMKEAPAPTLDAGVAAAEIPNNESKTSARTP